MIDYNPKSCVGCGICSISCPQKCIRMIVAESGEYRPIIDMKKCIKCGMCEGVCVVTNDIKKHKQHKSILKAYYGWSKDEVAKYKSSSGGVFYEIAKSFILNGGYVCGASLCIDDSSVEHIICHEISQLRLIQGSKYTESIIWKIIPEIKKLLDENKPVLFSGCPCHVSSLLRYLELSKKHYSNLYVIEVFCHGLPKIGVFKKYLSYLRIKHGKVNDLQFRSKKVGWRRPSYEIVTEKRTFYEEHNRNPYQYMFGSHESLRKNCFSCRYRGLTRFADLSLGDFWGCEEFYRVEEIDKGVSALLVNSSKGEALINNNELSLHECDTKEIFHKNPWMIKNYPLPSTYDKYLKNYKNMPPLLFFNYYMLYYRTVYRIKNFFSKFIKK